MEIQTKLEQGIKAAKNGDKATARQLLYAVLDEDPRNEAVWVWLSYVVETVEDRQICLENVLTINPTNQYALRGLAQISQLSRQQAPSSANSNEKLSVANSISKKDKAVLRPASLKLVMAFWFGLAGLLLMFALADVFRWVSKLLQTPTFPNYITPYQLWQLTIPLTFLILAILIFNVVWTLYIRHKLGYYASLLLALGFTLIGPMVILVSEKPNYLLATFAALMPAIILVLTLMSQAGFSHEQKLASNTK